MSAATSIPSIAELPFPVRRMSVDEYQRMGKFGILTEHDRVELLEGYITPKMIHNPPHDTSVRLADEAVRSLLSDDWHTRVQSAITTDDSEPEPDVVAVRGSIRDYAMCHPTAQDICLLIEVAVSSLQRDRAKRRLYARAGISTYWIINLVDRQVEVYKDPTDTAPEPRYLHERIFHPGQAIPLEIAGKEVAEIPCTDLLP